MIVRPEREGDIDAIRMLTETAFRTAPHADGTEHLIIDRLRAAGVLTLSLVAEADGTIVGHVAFSPVSLSDGSRGWYGLGPISVDPSRQGEGIGGKLIGEGLERLKALGATGCVLLGDPAYYSRFGFKPDPRLTLDGVPPEYFMRVAFSPVYGAGSVSYHPGFYG
ncbi:GNAT family N-acetyltransferase [Shinella zoogloeoides]|uniref:GNAT family N-acetyltransferase n=1 Tax=Shinella zoogloeoides TaxID=352475 RepID=UPI001F5A726F|nr:N-acetyltransferase [Shinella zoogloeoides]